MNIHMPPTTGPKGVHLPVASSALDFKRLRDGFPHFHALYYELLNQNPSPLMKGEKIFRLAEKER